MNITIQQQARFRILVEGYGEFDVEERLDGESLGMLGRVIFAHVRDNGHNLQASFEPRGGAGLDEVRIVQEFVEGVHKAACERFPESETSGGAS